MSPNIKVNSLKLTQVPDIATSHMYCNCENSLFVIRLQQPGGHLSNCSILICHTEILNQQLHKHGMESYDFIIQDK